MFSGLLLLFSALSALISLAICTLSSSGLERKSFTKEQILNLKKAYKIFFREGLRSEDALEKISNECEEDENIQIFIESIKSSSRGVQR